MTKDPSLPQMFPHNHSFVQEFVLWAQQMAGHAMFDSGPFLGCLFLVTQSDASLELFEAKAGAAPRQQGEYKRKCHKVRSEYPGMLAPYKSTPSFLIEGVAACGESDHSWTGPTLLRN